MNRTHTHKAMLTFTRDELCVLIGLFDLALSDAGQTPNLDALRARLVFALGALTPPRPGS